MPTGARSTFWNAVQPGTGLASLGIVSAAVSAWPWGPSMRGGLPPCCCNGGVIKPTLARGKTTFFAKMIAACGTNDEEEALAAWGAVDPIAPTIAPRSGNGYPLLIVQGGKDPMIPTAASEMLLGAAPTDDKEMVVFSDGDHCIYNHRDDRDALIADWARSRLAPLEPRASGSGRGVDSCRS